MSDSTAILEDAINRLFTEYVTPQLLRSSEAGEWPQKLWSAIEEMGLTQVFSGGSDDPWRDAAAIMKACGRHAVPVPLAEHLIASAIIAESAPVPAGLIGLSVRQSAQGHVVPWPDHTAHAVIIDNGAAALIDLKGVAKTPGAKSISREPRDTVTLASNTPRTGLKGRKNAKDQGDTVLVPAALMRAAQIAGALERVLALTVQYAKDRVQFGKPIGAYQAIQQQLAILATNSAAATRAVDAAFETAARGGDLFLDAATAKIRTGEAATIAASIAHQVHGAIGFTDEHTLHYFTRRLWTWRTEFGSESYWSKRLGTHALTQFGADGLWPAVTNAR